MKIQNVAIKYLTLEVYYDYDLWFSCFESTLTLYHMYSQESAVYTHYEQSAIEIIK